MVTQQCPISIDGYQCELEQFHDGRHMNNTYNPYGNPLGDPYWDDDDTVERREVGRHRRQTWTEDETLPDRESSSRHR